MSINSSGVEKSTQKFFEFENFIFYSVSLSFLSRALFMLLPSIFISVVVCTVEICEFLPVFLLFICTSRPLENLSPVSRDTCDNFSHFEASFFMPQTRGSCGYIKGTYDNHLSCINCCGCCRFHGCSVCNAWSDATWDLVHRRRLYSDRSMGKKEAKEKKLRKSASRTSSSSRPGLERTELADQTGSAAEGPDDDFASALSRSSSGVSETAEAPRFPSIAHTEHQVRSLRRVVGRPKVPPPPDPLPGIWQVSTGIRLLRKLSFRALTLLVVRTSHRAILPWARY